MLVGIAVLCFCYAPLLLFLRAPPTKEEKKVGEVEVCRSGVDNPAMVTAGEEDESAHKATITNNSTTTITKLWFNSQTNLGIINTSSSARAQHIDFDLKPTPACVGFKSKSKVLFFIELCVLGGKYTNIVSSHQSRMRLCAQSLRVCMFARLCPIVKRIGVRASCVRMSINLYS